MTKGLRRQFGTVALAGALVAALFLACSCAKQNAPLSPGAPEADKYLFDNGTEALNAKKWLVARDMFRRLVDNYPQSLFRADAKLGIGDTYLGENTTEAYVLAANEFREFLTYYPTHARSDYAQYKLGLAHFSQMRGPDRDQSETKEAVKEFGYFLQRYPNSSLAGEARAKLRAAQDRMSESEYLVGLFYYRSRWYPGAIDRFKSILSRDPGYTNRDAVYFYLGEALLKTNKKAEALPYFERLVQEFTDSDFLEQAHQRIAEAKTSHD